MERSSLSASKQLRLPETKAINELHEASDRDNDSAIHSGVLIPIGLMILSVDLVLISLQVVS